MIHIRPLLFVALLLASCNSILGNVDYHVVGAAGGTDAGPAKCQRNTDCALDEVCLFATCGRQCDKDRDCAMGSRCLKTDTGVACVSADAATCAAGCPAGSMCSPTDGACRNACDTTECLTGQTCTNGLCVGTSAHEAGSGGSGASDTSCVGKVCDTPPAAVCDSPAELKTHDKTGSCAAGVCSYTEHLIACTCQSDACTTDPCLVVTCDSPPDPNCKDTGTFTTYAASGTCTDGSCSYTPTDTDCPSNQQCGGTGLCSVCKADASCGAKCAACGAGTKKCKDLGTTSRCVACLSNADCSWPTPSCNTTTNVCEAPPSCSDLPGTCGHDGTDDCCAANLVAGGTFNRSNQDNFPAPATVADFRLDNYEITVGRFRKFVAAYSQTMTSSGAGQNPNNASDTGWDTSWNTSAGLPATGMLAGMLKCGAGFQTWTDKAGTPTVESLPINCIDWFEAEAFCIWDGGRLPTEAEWTYAAVGGTEQRTYPWGPNAPDCSYANFFTTDYCVLPGTGGVNRVGSEAPNGDGPYGQSDLAGNVAEWAQDWYAAFQDPCNNCANLVSSTGRVLRGGSFDVVSSGLLGSSRNNKPAFARSSSYGARCARAP